MKSFVFSYTHLYNTGVWTSILITEVIRKEFKIDYHPRHVRKLLKKMRFSFKRPKKVLSNADPKAQKSWKSYKYGRVMSRQKTFEKNEVFFQET